MKINFFNKVFKYSLGGAINGTKAKKFGFGA